VNVSLRNVAQPRLLQKALDGGVRRALLRPDHVFHHVRRFHRQSLDHGNQPARPRKALDALRDEPRRAQPVHQRFHEIRLGLRLHAGRDFLGQDFEQKLGHLALFAVAELAA